MIQELWALDLVPNYGSMRFMQTNDWLRRYAVAFAKHELVLHAYSAETGPSSDMFEAWIALEFESIIEREDYWKQEWSAEIVALNKENENEKYITAGFGHYILDVFK